MTYIQKYVELNNDNSIYDINFKVEKIINIIFLTEGSSKIGMGHIYRTISFANDLNNNLNCKLIFLTKSSQIVFQKIKNSGFNVKVFENDQEIFEILKNLNADIIVCDNIKYNKDLLMDVKKLLNPKIVLFDSLESEYDKYVDIVVNALISKNFRNLKFQDKNGTVYFCGLKYLILRDEFNKFKKNTIINPEIKRLLLIFGGSDPTNITTVVLDKLLTLDLGLELDVVIGPLYEYLDELNEILAKDKKNVNIHIDPDNIPYLMLKADLILTSPGISTFEALFFGKPIILIYKDSLQEYYYNSFSYVSVFKKAGIPILRKTDIENLESVLKKISPMAKRVEMFKTFKKMEIGLGKDEIIKEMIK